MVYCVKAFTRWSPLGNLRYLARWKRQLNFENERHNEIPFVENALLAGELIVVRGGRLSRTIVKIIPIIISERWRPVNAISRVNPVKCPKLSISMTQFGVERGDVCCERDVICTIASLNICHRPYDNGDVDLPNKCRLFLSEERWNEQLIAKTKDKSFLLQPHSKTNPLL